MHANSRLTPVGRLTMVMRIEAGRPVAHVAAEMGISRPTAYKWWHRWDELGTAGLVDRSSRPRSCPHQTSPAIEAQIEELRRTLKLGPARIGYRLGVPPSTVHRVLARLGVNRLSWMDRPTGPLIRRYERERTGGSSMWTSRVKSPTVGVGRRWVVWQERRTPLEERSATDSSTQPSTTTAAWPIQRS